MSEHQEGRSANEASTRSDLNGAYTSSDTSTTVDFENPCHEREPVFRVSPIYNVSEVC